MKQLKSPISIHNILALACAPALLLVTLGQETCSNNTVMLPMQDGVQLATDFYETDRADTAPTILQRTPYGKDGMQDNARDYNDRGYNLVAQDIRGSGDSDGIFMMFTDDGWGANQDGYDTVEWVTEQSWSNGEVCMKGSSALGITSLMAAGAAPPSLKCAYTEVAAGDLYGRIGFWGGALREELVVNWTRAQGALEALEELQNHASEDEFYDPVTLSDRYDQVHTAIYSLGGWYDIFSQGNLDVFTGVNTQGAPGGLGNQKLVIGPWSHGNDGPNVGQLVFPANSGAPDDDDDRWIDYWLKGVENGIMDEPPVLYYQMGDVDTPSSEWNVWRSSDVWPVPSTATSYYLLPSGGLSSQVPTEVSSSSSFTFDPSDPVPTLGGNNLFEAAGPYDQRPVENRADVLLFTSETLEAPVAITGRVKARLWVSSSALDTDFSVKLTDVYPDGRSMLVLDGIQRMRFREGTDHEVLMVPGDIYEVEVDLWSTALTFNAGHQIRVAISSSNSPRFHVNPNTGEPLYTSDLTQVVADQVLYHDADHPSQLILPVVGE